MLHYRIYQLDAAGRIAKATDRESADDEEACAAAAAEVLAPGTHGAVWQRARFARRITAAAVAAPAGQASSAAVAAREAPRTGP